jgi:dihydroorotase
VDEITIPKPDDWHLHLRDGAMLEGILPFSARHFARAIIMPNLVPPVVTSADAQAYRDRIMAAVPSGPRFHALDDALSDRRNRSGGCRRAHMPPGW